MSLDERRRIFEIARLMIEAGAEVREDALDAEVVFRDTVGCFSDRVGFRFVKRLFDVGLGAAEDGTLRYVLRPGTQVAYVETLPVGLSATVYADFERNRIPEEFWDDVYHMVRRLRRALFGLPSGGPSVSWELLADVWKRHRGKPMRETLLLARRLSGFIEEESLRWRSRRKEWNRTRGPLYRKMLRLAEEAPHSLNRLREFADRISVKRIGSSYWRVDVEVRGREFSGYGFTPVGAAGDLLRVAGRRLREVCGRAA